jgi:hypothetical protein
MSMKNTRRSGESRSRLAPASPIGVTRLGKKEHVPVCRLLGELSTSGLRNIQGVRKPLFIASVRTGYSPKTLAQNRLQLFGYGNDILSGYFRLESEVLPEDIQNIELMPMP